MLSILNLTISLICLALAVLGTKSIAGRKQVRAQDRLIAKLTTKEERYPRTDGSALFRWGQ